MSENDRGSLPFRNENVYAGGVARRPRKARDKSASMTSTCVLPSIHAPESLKPSSSISSSSTLSACRYSSGHNLMHELGPISKSLGVSLEVQAFTYFMQIYIDTSDALPPDSIWDFLSYHRVMCASSEPTSALGLTTAALSLAIFSRTKATPAALVASTHKYIQALAKTKSSLEDMNQVATDRLLLTVMLLSNYEV